MESVSAPRGRISISLGWLNYAQSESWRGGRAGEMRWLGWPRMREHVLEKRSGSVCLIREGAKDRDRKWNSAKSKKSGVKERWGHCRNSNGEEPYFSPLPPFTPNLPFTFFMCHTLWLITSSSDSCITWHGYIILLWSQFTAECCSWQICHLFNGKLSYEPPVWRTLWQRPMAQ